MIAAFMIVYALGGDVLSFGESKHKFDTIETCQEFNIKAMRLVVADMAGRGTTEFDRIETKCLPDIGQSAADVFAQPQPQYQAPSPDATDSGLKPQ